MVYKISLVLDAILRHWNEVLIGGIIMTSAIIVLVGILKKLVIDKIKNKLVRKIVLSFMGIAFVFPSVAIYFAIEHISFSYYWYAVILLAFAEIITYWLYENTGLRSLISLIGKKVIAKYSYIALSHVVEDKETDMKVELVEANKDLKADTKKEIKKSLNSYKVDKDLNDL